jgi:hypothetical protein
MPLWRTGVRNLEVFPIAVQLAGKHAQPRAFGYFFGSYHWHSGVGGAASYFRFLTRRAFGRVGLWLIFAVGVQSRQRRREYRTRYCFRNSSGNLAKFAAISLASSLVSIFAVNRLPGSSSK